MKSGDVGGGYDVADGVMILMLKTMMAMLVMLVITIVVG